MYFTCEKDMNLRARVWNATDWMFVSPQIHILRP